MKFLWSRHFLAGVAMALTFVPLWWFLPTTYLFDLVNALTVSVGIGVLIAYLPGIARSFTMKRWTGANFLVLGIVAAWVAIDGRHLWNWIWRYSGKPDAMIDHPLVAFMVWLTAWAGVLHLAAKGAIDRDIPRENWLKAGAFIAFGLALGSIVIVVLEPSSHP